ncbi:MAG TPA: hypothetical protein VJV78_19670 [Polyangiales bacterium]|nr:hypothetical protein [Polyangiales bacterium]
MRKLWGACAVALVACGGGGGGDENRETPADGRGTEACRLWQDSVCDWAERCQPEIGRKACDEQFQGVTCKSDEIAGKCMASIDSAGCDGIPDRCGPDEIADPAPAVHACEMIPARFCARAVECGISATQQDCLRVEKQDCSGAFSFTLDYEDCLMQIDDLDCSVFLQPALCKRVIVSRAPSPVSRM